MISLVDYKERFQKRGILAAMTCCLACIFLDTNAIPLALPSMQKELGFSGFFLQWILNIFYIVTAVFVIFAGKLADTIGRKKIFCLGAIFYSLCAAFAGFCNLPVLILILRGIQGLSAALMMPSAMAIMVSEFPSNQLGKALGFSAGISSIFLCIGPFLGGVITEVFSWKLIFLLPLPLSIASLILAWFFVSKGEKNKSKLDIKGLLLLIIGIGTLMFGLMQVKYSGWFSQKSINYTIISFVVLLVLYYHSKLIEFPLLDFSLFKIPSLALGLALAFISQFIATYTVFIAIFFQKALFYSPIDSGAHIVVANLPILFGAPASGIIVDRKGVQFPLKMGFLLLLFSMFMLIFYTMCAKQFILFIALGAFGSSFSFITTPVSYIALKDVPYMKKGLAAGIYNTVRYLGSAFGIVCIGWIGYFFRMAALENKIKKMQLPNWVEASKVDEILKMVGCIPNSLAVSLKSINTESFFVSLNAMTIFISLFVCVGLLLTFLYLNDYKKT